MTTQPDAVTHYREVVLQKVRLKADGKVTNQVLHDLDFGAATDMMADLLVVQLRTIVAGNARDLWETEVHAAPATWWDMWKRSRCPRWLARHLAPPQVRTWTRVRRRQWTDLYPEVPLPRDQFGDRVVMIVAD
jgi:hypothetical protein